MLFGDPVPKEDRQLGVDHAPVLPPACPFLRNIHHGQIQHFQKAVVCGEHGFGLGHLPELAVEALNGVGGVDQPPDLLGELEIDAQIGPILPPGPRDLGVFLVPALREGIQSVQCR